MTQALLLPVIANVHGLSPQPRSGDSPGSGSPQWLCWPGVAESGDQQEEPPEETGGHAQIECNAVLLGIAPYQDQRWLTYKQAAQLGGNVRKGEKSSLVMFWKQHTVKDEHDEESTKFRTVSNSVLHFFPQEKELATVSPRMSFAYRESP